MSKSSFRGVFKYEEEQEDWKQAVREFPNKIPRFTAKADAEKFVLQHANSGSNPDFNTLYHSITTLVSWEQITKHLLPKIREYRNAPVTDAPAVTSPPMSYPSHSPMGTGADIDGVDSYLQSRLNLPIHRKMSSESVLNTLKYLFFHMRCGIYVMIKDNEVAIFCPFVNKDYENIWRGALKYDSADGTVERYYDDKATELGREFTEKALSDQANWWANGNIICNYVTSKNEGDSNQYLGDHFLLQLKDMFSDLCSNCTVPDCEFFINKRDYPHIKFNVSIARGIPVEPYGFIFDRDDKDPEQDLPLMRHLYSSYAPVLSFYTSDRFADIPIPSTEDWEAACGEVFPASFVCSERAEDGSWKPYPSRDLFTAANLKKFETPWAEKVNTAFFRGTATGGGTTPDTNQRLHLAMLSEKWSHSKHMFTTDNTAAAAAAAAAAASSAGVAANAIASKKMVPYLDAKITGWNTRDKKIASSSMTYIRPKSFPFENKKNLKLNYVPIYKQASFKYLIYVEGHCAACRYGFMMQMGSVILKVESKCVASEIWYFPLLQPYVDHIPVKADLSDLEEKLKWCHEHDEECAVIAANAQKLYKQRVGIAGIRSYLRSICQGIAQRSVGVPSWAAAPPQPRPVPCTGASGTAGSSFCYDNEDGQRSLCVYCEAASKELAKKRTQEQHRLQDIDGDGGKSGQNQLQQHEEATAKKRRMLKERMKQRKAAGAPL